MVVLKEPFSGWWSNYKGRLKSSWTHHIIPFTFSQSGCSIVRSASLAKGGTSKKRPSLQLHKVPNHTTTMLPPPLQLGVTVTASLCIIAAHCRQSTNFSNGSRICLHIIPVFTTLLYSEIIKHTHWPVKQI
jgi:hypothetical protein